MKLLEDKILQDGKLLPGNILRVDNFLNHQIDVALIDRLGEEFYRLYRDCGVTKLLTVEASGIGIACLSARYFNVPVVFAKKAKGLNSSDDCYRAEVASFTHKNVNTVTVSRDYLHADDRVLIIDDFLADGNALRGLCALCTQAGATVVGAGIVIEKAFQGGGDSLRAEGLRIESLAMIQSMSTDTGILFTH